MGRKSSISRLPLPVKKAIDDALKTGQFSLDQILGSIRDQYGAEVAPSRSALGRYSQRFEEVGKRIRESREVAQVWAEKLGQDPQGETGKLVLELLRTLAFDATLAAAEGETELKAGELNKLALTMQRLESASKWNLQREQVIRKAALEEAATKIEKQAKKRGISSDTANWIRAEILGINDAKPQSQPA